MRQEAQRRARRERGLLVPRLVTARQSQAYAGTSPSTSPAMRGWPSSDADQRYERCQARPDDPDVEEPPEAVLGFDVAVQLTAKRIVVGQDAPERQEDAGHAEPRVAEHRRDRGRTTTQREPRSGDQRVRERARERRTRLMKKRATRFSAAAQLLVVEVGGDDARRCARGTRTARRRAAARTAIDAGARSATTARRRARAASRAPPRVSRSSRSFDGAPPRASGRPRSRRAVERVQQRRGAVCQPMKRQRRPAVSGAERRSAPCAGS